MKLLCALIALTALAQEQPVFRTGTRLVEVNVVVRDKHGPVAGLTKADFSLADNGNPQQIAFFAASSAETAQSNTTPLPPGTVSNRLNRRGETPRNATILLIDRLNTPYNYQPYANRKIIEFLKTHDKDRLGIYTLTNKVRALQDLTSDTERLSRAVQGLKPQQAAGLTDDVTIEPTGDAVTDQMIADSLSALQDVIVKDRVQATKEAMIAIAHHLAHVPGRKNPVWVSASFPLIIIRPHETIEFTKELNEASRALSDADVAVYPVDARGLMSTGFGAAEQGGFGPANCTGRGPCIARPEPSGGTPGVDTMNMLASLTGGIAYYHTNGIEQSIQKASEDAEFTYTLGFYPSEESFDDQFHRLNVKVATKGADVRFRRGYVASKTLFSQTATLNQLLTDPLDATAIGLMADAKPTDATTFRVHVRIDLHDIHLEPKDGKATGTVNLALFVEGSKTATSITRKLEIPEAELASALAKGIEITGDVRAESPTADLHVVALDPSTGAGGSVRLFLTRK
jgi:VWFA-related protein